MSHVTQFAQAVNARCRTVRTGLSRRGFRTTIAFLPDSHRLRRNYPRAGATHQSARANKSIMDSHDAYQNSSGLVQRLSLLDTGTDAYLRQTAQSMSHLVSSATKISIAGPLELEATHSCILSMLLRDRDGNLHELLIDAGHKSAIGYKINFSKKGHLERCTISCGTFALRDY